VDRRKDARVDSTLLECRGRLRRVVLGKCALQSDVHQHRALPARVVELIDLSRQKCHAQVDLSLGSLSWIGDRVELEAGCAQKDVESGWDLSAESDRVRLGRGLQRDLGDDAE